MKEKTIPTTVNQCISPDNVTKDLWRYAGLLKTIGGVSATIIGFCGIILSAIISDFAGGNGRTLLLGMVYTVVITVADYFIFFIISLFVKALANILYNTHISANVALLNAGSTLEIVSEKNAESNSERIVIDKAPINQSQVKIQQE